MSHYFFGKRSDKRGKIDKNQLVQKPLLLNHYWQFKKGQQTPGVMLRKGPVRNVCKNSWTLSFKDKLSNRALEAGTCTCLGHPCASSYDRSRSEHKTNKKSLKKIQRHHKKKKNSRFHENNDSSSSKTFPRKALRERDLKSYLRTLRKVPQNQGEKAWSSSRISSKRIKYQTTNASRQINSTRRENSSRTVKVMNQQPRNPNGMISRRRKNWSKTDNIMIELTMSLLSGWSRFGRF